MGPSFPKWLQTQSNIWRLDLSSASISDEVPKWLWNLSPELFYLNLSNNQISGTIPDLSYNSLHTIDVSSNKFLGPLPLIHSYSIISVQLSLNMFSGPISSFICSISSNSWLQLLDLSNNQLGGALPNCWENMTALNGLNLNNNCFSGEIPHAFGYLTVLNSLHLGRNNLSGELPSTLKNCRGLRMIDIGGNKLTGNIPSWLGGNYPNLSWLSLRQNRFYGDIPPEICYLTQIQILDLSENNISGKIPDCFNNFTSLVSKNTTTIDSTQIYFGYGSYIDYAFVQRNGQESEYKTIDLELLKFINLSSNRLVGNIPRAFSNLRELITLNLSRNNLTGSIDPNIGQMEMLEMLDLSRNQLSGHIPIGLAQLHFLSTLNLSDNNLSGKIPLGTQLQGFNPSAYGGNSELCGLPLPLCPGDRKVPPILNQRDGSTDDEDVWFLSISVFQGPWISVIFGFIVGFWGIIGSLLLKKSWRTAYFSFWDGIGDWFYVTALVFFRKLKRN